MIDTHTHLLDECFDGDREAVITALNEKGVKNIIENATDAADMVKVAALAKQHAFIYGAVGVHPHSASEYNEETELLIKRLCESEKIVALGEIGLDYHYDFSPRETQKSVFERQMLLAREIDIPVVIHSREAAQDTFDIVKKIGGRGEIHCFSGSAAMAAEYVKLGFYIGFGGAVTFKNASKLLEAVKAVPADMLLTETDCPYMTPEPFRGRRNEPSFVKLVIEKISEIKGVPASELEKITEENARALFGIAEK